MRSHLREGLTHFGPFFALRNPIGPNRYSLKGWILGPSPFSLPNSPECVEKLSEKGRRSLRYSLSGHRSGTFRPIWTPSASQIHTQSGARAPFRTVSEGEFSEIRMQELA